MTQPPPLPTGGQFKAGTGSLIGAANSLTVKQTSQRAIVEFNQFSVGKGNSVSFQNGTGATLARVTGGSLTQILGNLKATGTLFLINPAGVVVDSSGVVVTNGSFVASTHNVADNAFMAGGTLLFKGDSTAAVTNNGSISSTNGNVFLIARSVTNNGVITASQGMVGLEAGDAVLLQDSGQGEHVYVQATDDGHTGDATNTGAITAAQAELQANGGNVYALVVNGGGAIRATGTETRDGHVWLSATGTASAPASVVANGTISARNADGSGGQITVQAVAPATVPAATAQSSVKVGGTLDAGGTTGGTIIVTGPQVGLVTGAALTVSSAKGGGTILVGGDLHGGTGATKFLSSAVTNAQFVTVERGVTIAANALKSGSGGNVVVWSDQTTSFAGAISAQGAGTGSGGFAEVSGKGVLNFAGFADLSSAFGAAGTLLLDPTDVTITTSATTGSYVYASGVYSNNATAATSNLNVTDLLTELAVANLVVSTSSTGSGAGTIDVQTSIGYTGATARSLTMTANSSITLEAGVGITSTNAALAVTLNSNASNTGGAVQMLAGSSIVTDGGNVQLGNVSNGAVGTAALTRGVYLTGASINAGAGSITIAGTGYATGSNNGVEISGSTLQTSGGAITITGTGANASSDGVLLSNGTVINAGATGNIAITGTGGSGGYGIYNATNSGAVNLGGAGDGGSISLTADTMNLAPSVAYAFLVQTTGQATVTTKTAGAAINLGNTVGTAAGTLELSQAIVADFSVGTLQVGSAGASGSGVLSITNPITATSLKLASHGAITEVAPGALAITTLSVQGDAAVSLAPTGSNVIGSLASASAGTSSALTLVDTGALSITGAVAAGSVSIRTTGGNLTIAAGGSVAGTATGYSVVLATDSAFINARGAAAVTTGSGNFAIYSVDPTNDTQDGLAGTNVYGQTYTASPSYSVAGNLYLHTVVPTLTVSSTSTIVYGNAAPTLAASFTGLLGGDLPTTATTGTAALSTTATSTTNVGTYTVAVGAGTMTSPTGYVLTFAAGAVTVTPRPLTLTVDGASRVYGAINPTFGYTVAGLANGDLFLQSPSFSTTSGTASQVATYAADIVASGGSAGSNYTIASYVAGAMTVTQATLSVTPDNFVRTYGLVNPNFTATVVGATGGDTASLLVSELGLVSSATTASSVATYSIVPSSTVAGRLANYVVSYTPGVLTVTQAALTVVAATTTRAYGDANPVLSAVLTGLTGADQSSTIISALALATSATTASPVGFYSIVAGNTTLTNYSVNFTGAQLVVTARPLTLIANGYTRAYGAAEPSLGYSEVGLVNGDALLAEPSLSLTSTLLASTGVGTYAGAVHIGGALVNHNYTVTYQTGSVTVIQAALSVTANSISRFYGSVDSGLSATLLGVTGGDTASTVIAALGLISNASGTSPVGTGYSITATTTTGGVLNNYSVTFTAGALSVIRAPLTVTVDAPTQFYGNTTPALTAAISGVTGADTSGSLLTALALSSATITTATSVGTYAISVGNTTTGPFTNYSVTLNNASISITARPITLTANGFTRTYGSADPSYSYTATNFVGSDTLLTQPFYTTTLTNTSNAGYYSGGLFVVGGTVGSNYTIVARIGAAVSITPANLTIDVGSTSRPFGTVNPSFGATLSGVTGADVATDLLTDLAIRSSATANSPSTTYAIAPTSLTAGQLSNYAITVNPGVLTISGAALTVSIDAKSRLYGAADPSFTASLQGVTGGDSVASLVSALDLTAGVTTNTGVGTYNITAPSWSNGPLANYVVTVMTAKLTITPAPLTVVLGSATRFYGDSLVTYTAAMTGVTGADTNAGLLSNLQLSSTAVSTSSTGVYQINDGSLAYGQLANYLVNYTGNLLTVTPRPLTITADDTSRIYGGIEPAYTFTVTNIASFDSLSTALLSKPGLTTTAVSTDPVGAYAINVSGGVSSANYTITSRVAGVLSIIPAPLTVYVDSENVHYGSLPSLSASFAGNVESAATLTTALGLSSVVTTTTSVGTYAIDVGTTTGGVFSNYVVTVVPGYVYVIPQTITVTGTYGVSGSMAPSLIVGVADQSRYYGAQNPSFTASISGVAGNDTTASILAALALTTTATSTSNIGIYSIYSTANFSSTNSVLSNYAIDFHSGSLTVMPLALTVTANSLTRVYGSSKFTSAFGYSVTGLLDGDTLVNEPAFSFSNTTTTATGVGTIAGAVSLSGGGGGNYTIVSYMPGSLVISPAPLTVQVNPQTRYYGSANPALTALLAGVTGPDDAATLLADLSLTTSALTSSPVGSYLISAGSTVAAGLANYTVTVVSANLTIKAAPLTLNIGSASTTYGAPTPSYSTDLIGYTGTDSSSALMGVFQVVTSETSTSGVGVYFVAPTTITGGLLNNYVITINSGQITVGARSLTITASDNSHAYGAANASLSYSVSGLVNGDHVSTDPLLNTTTTNASGVGVYGGDVVATSADAGPNYAITYLAGATTITRAELTVTANDFTRFYGNANPLFTASFSGVTGADTTGSLISALSLSTTATMATGIGTAAIVAGVSLANYDVTFNPGTLTITPRPLTIIASDASHVYGSALPALTYTTSGLVNGDTLSVLPSLAATHPFSADAGIYTGDIVASGAAGSTNYAVASYIAGTMTVTQAALTVTIGSTTRLFGGTNPSFSASFSGIVNGDVSGTLQSALGLASAATTSSNVNTYAITNSGSLANYSLTVVQGTLTVNPAPLTLTEVGQTLVYGGVILPIGSSLIGVTGGNSIAQITSLLALSTPANDSSGVGTYGITTASLSTPGLSNYAITINAASIVITPASLTIDVDNKTRLFGSANPVFTAGFTGIAGDDTPTGLLGDLLLTAAVSTSTGVGAYAINSSTLSNGQLANYTITIHPGTLSITPALLTVSVNPATRLYGAANPSLSATVTGATGGDSDSTVAAQLSLTANATTSSPVGNYAIISSNLTGGALANYSIFFAGNSLTVTPAPLSISGVSYTRTYGSSDPSFSANFVGVTGGDLEANMWTALLLSAGTTSNSSVGSYTIAAGQTRSGIFSNYNVTFTPGQLTITPATLNVVGNNATRLYGGTDPTFLASLVGVTGGDLPTSILSSLSFNAGDHSNTSVGNYQIVIGNTTSGAVGNYVIGTYTPGTLTINPASLTVAAVTTSRLYGAVNPTFSATFTGLTGGDTSAILLPLLTLNSAATTLSSIGSTYTIVAGSTAALTNYTVAYTSAPLTINPAPLSIIGQNYTRLYYTADPASYNAAISGATGNETASQLLADLALTSHTDQTSNVGSYTINGTTAGPDFANYTVSFTKGTLVITPQPLNVIGDSTGRIYGASEVPYTASVTFATGPDSSASLISALVLNTTTSNTTSIGTYTIGITGPTTSGILQNYAITLTPGHLTITPAALSIGVGNYSRTYGGLDPSFTATFSGITGADTSGILIGNLSLTHQLTTQNIGTYSILEGSTTAGQLSNYTITTYTAGNLTIGQALLTVAATNNTQVYGHAASTGLTFTGATGGDSLSTLTTLVAPTYAVGGGSQPSVGTYTIGLTGNTTGGRLDNYQVTLANGSFVVTPATLTVTANTQTIVYDGLTAGGGTFGVSYSGFVYGDNAGNALTGTSTITYSGTATSAVNVGSYGVTASGLSNVGAANYTITYVAGKLSITPAPLTVTVNALSVGYNGRIAYSTGSSATLSYGVTGFVHGETSAGVITGTATVTSAASTAINVGTYNTGMTGLAASNYSISYVSAPLTIGAVPLTIVGTSYSKRYGDTDPSFSATFDGIASGDSTAGLLSNLALLHQSNTTPIGTYSITGNTSAGQLSNYIVTFTPGDLTIANAFLTVTANNLSRIYGQGITYGTTLSGFTAGDNTATLLSELALTYGIGTSATSPSVGTYTITNTAGSVTAGNLSNYAISFVTGLLSITPAPLTVTVNSQTNTYTSGTFGFSVSYNGFTAGDTLSALAGTLAYSGTGVGATNVGSYSATASGLTANDGNYTISYAAGTLSITPAHLTVTANQQTVVYNGSIAYGSSASFSVAYTGSGLLGSDASTIGTIQYSTNATTAKNVGSYALTASGLSGSSASNYAISYVAGLLSITPAPLTVTVNSQTVTYTSGTFGFTVGYSPFQGGDTAATALTGTDIYSGTAVTAKTVGNYTATASGLTAVSGNYSITYASGNLSIVPASLTVTANSPTVVYDGSIAYGTSTSFGVSYGGGLLGSDATTIGTIHYDPASLTAKNVGSYVITPSGLSGSSASNYAISYVAGLLSITPAPLTVTVVNQTHTYTSNTFGFSVGYTGFVGGETATVLGGTPTYSGTGTSATTVGSYSATASGLMANNGNYTISYAAGTLSITPAALTVTANTQTVMYNGSVAYGSSASFGVTYTGSGLLGSDAGSIGTIQYSANATTAINVGSYAVTPSGLSGSAASNYTISYHAGLLSITPAPLTVTVASQTNTYTSGTFGFSVGYSPFQGSDGAATALTGTPGYSGTGVGAITVGSYSATASGLSAVNGNYTISYAAGTLSITPAALTVTANTQTVTYNGSIAYGTSASFGATYSGVLGSDQASLGTVLYDSTSTSAKNVGSYAVTPSGLSGSAASNYSISYDAGLLSITPALLTVTVVNQTNTYTSGTFGFSVGYTGFVGSETATVLSGTPSYSGTGTSATNVGSYSATASGLSANNGNYTISYAAGTLSITPAALTVTANTQTVMYNGSVAYGSSASFGVTYGGSGLLGSDAGSIGTIQYDGTSTSAKNAGSYAVTPSGLSGSAASNYTISYIAGLLSITPAPLTVTVTDQTVTYTGHTFGVSVGYSPFQGGDTADTALTGTPVYSGSGMGGFTVGSYSAIASGLTAVNGNYSLTYAAGTLSITPAPLTVTANIQTVTYNGSIAYGTSASFGASYTGVLGSDQASLGTVLYDSTSTSAKNVGSYAVTPSGLSGSAASNYTISYAAGLLSITPALLTVTVVNQTNTYTSGTFGFGVGYTGFVGSETATVLSGTPSYTGTGTSAINVGSYSATASGLSANNGNYTISYAAGTLSITPAALTVTANSQSVTYNGSIAYGTSASFGVAYNGVLGSDAGSLGTIGYDPTSTAAKNAGSYSVTPSGLSGSAASNYAITYVSGLLSIAQAPLTVTANNQSVTYNGSAAYGTSTSFGVGYAGVLGSDAGSLGTIGYDPTATAAKNAGSYGVTPSGLSGSAASNYAITYVSGVLSIGQAPLTVTANSLSVIYNGSVAYGSSASFGAAYAGVQGSDQGSLGTIAFDPTSTNAKNAGSYGVTPSGLSGSAASNYAITYVSGLLSIAPAALTVTANSLSVTYDGSVAYGGSAIFGVAYSGLQGADTAATALGGTVAYDPASTAAKNAGSYAITPSGLTASNYAISYQNGQLSIGQAPLTVTANSLSVAYNGLVANGSSASFGYGISGLLGTDTGTALGGTAAYGGAATSAINVGSYPVTVGGLSAANYAISYAPGTLAIGAIPLTIVVNSYSRLYGGTDPSFGATLTGIAAGDSSAGLIGGLALARETGSSVGSYAIAAGTTAGQLTNYIITMTPGLLSITPATLTVSPGSASRFYGDANPSLSATLQGVTGGDSVATLLATIALSTPATTTSNVGSYAITATSTTSLSNYTLVMNIGELDVVPRPLVLTATDGSVVYGSQTPSLGYSVAGLVNGDTITTAPTLSTDRLTTSNVGGYAIDLTAGSAGSNYVLSSYVPGVLSVTAAPLTVAIPSASRLYGSDNPAFTALLSGITGADDFATLLADLQVATAATSASNVGSYAIAPGSTSAGALANYTISVQTGSLAITPATLTYVATQTSRTYGATNTLDGSLTGFVLDQNQSTATTGTLTFSSVATAGSNVGTYSVTGSGLAANAGNYVFVQAPPNATALTVTPATATVTAENATRLFSTANPNFVIDISGLLNGDASTVISGLSATTLADLTSQPATYAITPAGGAAVNYDLVYVPGVLTVTPMASMSSVVQVPTPNQSNLPTGGLPTTLATTAFSTFLASETQSGAFAGGSNASAGDVDAAPAGAALEVAQSFGKFDIVYRQPAELSKTHEEAVVTVMTAPADTTDGGAAASPMITSSYTEANAAPGAVNRIELSKTDADTRQNDGTAKAAGSSGQ